MEFVEHVLELRVNRWRSADLSQMSGCFSLQSLKTNRNWLLLEFEERLLLLYVNRWRPGTARQMSVCPSPPQSLKTNRIWLLLEFEEHLLALYCKRWRWNKCPGVSSNDCCPINSVLLLILLCCDHIFMKLNIVQFSTLTRRRGSSTLCVSSSDKEGYKIYHVFCVLWVGWVWVG